MGDRNITKKEMLLAVAMSEYYQVTHVHYIPPRVNFTKMLLKMRNQKLVEPNGLSNYKLTEKGRNYIRRQDIEQFSHVDRVVDNFIDSL